MSTQTHELPPRRARFGRRTGGRSVRPAGRTRNLVAAAALALVAGLLTIVYGNRGADTAPVAEQTVYVATADVAAGTPVAEALRSFEPKVVAAGDAVPGAIASPAEVAGRVVTEPIYAGEQVSVRRFGGGELEGVRAELSGRLRAISIAGTAQQVLAGTLVRGDRVDVVASTEGRTRIVLRNVVVAQAPDAPAVSQAVGSDNVTTMLQLTDDQAARLFHAIRNAEWSLILRPRQKPANGPTTTYSSATLVGGE